MACNLTIDFKGNAGELIQTLAAKVRSQGGIFEGNEQSGSIKVTLMGSGISGSYTIAGQQMQLTIDQKPFFISCDQLQSYLTGNMS